MSSTLPASTKAILITLACGIGGSVLVFDPRVNIHFSLSSLFNIPKYMVMALTAMVIFILAIRQVKIHSYSIKLFDLGITFYIFSLGISCIINRTPLYFVLDWICPEASALIMLAGAACIGYDYRNREAVIRILVAFAAILSFLVLYEALGGYAPWSIYRRPAATIGSRNLVCAVLGLLFPLAIARLINKQKLVDVSIVIAMTASIAICRTRSVWLAIFITLIVLTLWLIYVSRRSSTLVVSKRSLILLCLSLILGCMAVTLLPLNGLNWSGSAPIKDSFSRILDYQNGSGQARVKQHLISFTLWSDAPFLGHGPGGFRRIGPLYASQIPKLDYFPFPEMQRPHSEFLRIVVHGGLLALIGMTTAIAGLFFPCFIRLHHRVVAANSSCKDIVLDVALCASLFFACVHSLFDVSVSRPPMIALLAIIVGLMRSHCPTLFTVRPPTWSCYLSLALGGLMLASTILRFVAALILYPNMSFKNLLLAEKWFPMPVEAGYYLAGNKVRERYQGEFSGIPNGLSDYLARTISSLPYDVPLLVNGAIEAIHASKFEEAHSLIRRGLAINPRDKQLLTVYDQLLQAYDPATTALTKFDWLPSSLTLEAVIKQTASEFGIPENILLAITFAESRFHVLSNEQGQRQWIKLMKWRAARAPKEGANLLGTTERVIDRDPYMGLRAAAALLQIQFNKASIVEQDESARWRRALMAWNDSPDHLANKFYVDQIFMVLEKGFKGIDDNGNTLLVASTRTITAKTGIDQNQQAGRPSNLIGQAGLAYYQLNTLSHRPLADTSREIKYIIIHATENSFSNIFEYFRRTTTSVGSHYMIRSSDGLTIQFADERLITFHDACFNEQSIGIEHEGYVSHGQAWYSDALYRASAQLVRDIAQRHKIPLNRQHILGHDEAPDCSEHSDPGKQWDWDKYMSYLQEPLAKSSP